MHIAVIGSGAVGLYYGAKLATCGHQVSFLMRSGLRTAREQGIHVIEDHGEPWNIANPSIAASTDEIGRVQVVVIALKTTDNAVLPEIVPPLLRRDTLLLTLQNGLGIEDDLARAFPAHAIAGGLCFVCLNRINPAQVRHLGTGYLTLGLHKGSAEAVLAELADSFIRSGVPTRLVDNLHEARWRKLMWNIPFNGLGIVAGGIGVDKILADADLLKRCRALIAEVRQSANALGCSIEAGFEAVQIENTRHMGDYHPSTVIDYIAGKTLEIESIWERPLQIARAAGVPMPHLEKLYKALRAING